MATTRQHIQFRRDTAANWSSVNPVLLAGEAGFETDTGSIKIGNGTAQWSLLPYVGGNNRLQDLADVSAANKANGSVLIYDTGSAKFVADAINTKLTLTDGGNF